MTRCVLKVLKLKAISLGTNRGTLAVAFYTGLMNANDSHVEIETAP
jgi:hypothetical protein